MAISFKAIIFTFLIMLAPLYANEIFVREENDVRQFVSVERSLGTYILREFSQKRGEFPNLVQKINLENKDKFNKHFNTHYKNLKKVNDLTDWSFSISVDENQTKALSSRFLGFKKSKAPWYATNRWNDEWEEKFAKWLSEEVDDEFFLRYKIPTDCADAIVGLRWIFARINSLPAAHNIMGGGLFGNFSARKEWSKYSTAKNWYDDNLFMASLYYVMDMTSTRTINQDGFPIKLNKEAIKPGIFIVTQNEGGGHAKIVTQTNFDKITELPIYTLASTLPRQIRKMQEEVMLDQDWPEFGNKDILAFKWVSVVNGNWVLENSLERKEYSLEQYDLNLKVANPIFIQYILEKTKGKQDLSVMLEVSAKDIASYIKHRVEIVRLGNQKCQKMDCSAGSVGDDSWGTQSRDKKILQKFHDTEKLVEEFGNHYPNLLAKWQRLLVETKVNIEGVELSLSGLRFIFDKNIHSSLGSDPIDKRWGISYKNEINNWINEIESLLVTRNQIIEKDPRSCLEDCSPRSIGWLGLNTYHEDKRLNELFTLLKSYCELLGGPQCTEYLSSFTKQYTFNNTSKNLSGWIDEIPFFNSDPRATKESRWGNIDANIRRVVLPNYNTVVVAENEIALLDGHHVFDLRTGNTIYKTGIGAQAFLNKNGSLLEVDTDSKKIDLLSSVNSDWRKITFPKEFFESSDVFTIDYLNDSRQFLILKKIEGLEVYELIDSQIVMLDQAVKNYEVFENFLVLKKEKSISIINQKNSADQKEYTLESIKDPSSLSLKKITTTHGYFSYEDKNNDIYKAYELDFRTKTISSLISKKENYLVKFIDPANKRLIIQEKFNAEYSSILLYKWGQNETAEVLENEIAGSYSAGNFTYILSIKGGKWDQNLQKNLYVWSEEKLQRVDDLNGFGADQIFESNLILSQDFKGRLIYLNDMSYSYVPGNIQINSSCSSVIGSKDTLTYSYNYMYGDYRCMGAVMLEKGANKLSTPFLTLYSWKNDEDLIEKLWLKQSVVSKAYKGTIVTIGKNVSYWIDI